MCVGIRFLLYTLQLLLSTVHDTRRDARGARAGVYTDYTLQSVHTELPHSGIQTYSDRVLCTIEGMNIEQLSRNEQ